MKIPIEMKEDTNMDETLKKVVGKNPITDSIVDDKTSEQRYKVFCAIHDLVRAAEDLYCEGEMKFDKVVSSLSEAISKLEGKESQFIEAYKKDSEDDEEGKEEKE